MVKNEVLVTELAKSLININTENPPGREKQVTKFIQDYLWELKIESELIEFESGRFNLVAVLGKGNGGLMLNGHTDTVPLGDTPTYSNGALAKVSGNSIYGRGAADMKGALAAILASLHDLEPNKFKRKLLLSFVGDEESKFKGSKWLIKNRSRLFGGIKYGIVAEPTGMKIQTAQRGLLGAKITFSGKMSHASTPWLGSNAIAKAAKFISQIEMPENKIPEKDVMTITKINGGIAGNVVPNSCEVHIDRRIIPGHTTKDAISKIKTAMKKVDPKAKFEVKVAQEAFSVDSKSQIVQTLKSLTGGSTFCSRFYTEAELYGRAFGMDCVVFGPGEPKFSHKANEHVSILNLKKSTAVFESLIKKWCI
ncbi:MAG: ArgE/DapE family deacylase [Candidatus Micrarchaeota archaeon]|nr:ArgE/DapE family deacylase [Candidatus Micrarchaeota archaeon]